MNAKEFFKSLLGGMAIGVSSAVPGVSGGTIAVILKIYEKLIWAISNIFKEFKKAIIYLLPILLGVVIALIPTMYLMHKALDSLLFAVICMFAGFIIGSLPDIYDEVKDKPLKKSFMVVFAISMLVAVGLGVASAFANADLSSVIYNPPVWMYFVLIPVGVIASIALVVPGISGSMLLLLLGFYEPLIDSTIDTMKACLNGNWSHFGIQVAVLLCFAIGVVVGFYFISKLMHYLISKFREMVFYSILGFVSGSTVALFYNYKIAKYYLAWAGYNIPDVHPYLPLYVEIPLGVALLGAALIGSYMLVRYKRKINKDEKKED